LDSWAENYNKHLPFYDRSDWKTVVRETRKPPRGQDKKKPVARYIHDPVGKRTLPPEQIRNLEFAIASGGNEIPKPPGSIRVLWGEVSVVVGASLGQETKFIRVELAQGGTYHGRPITKEELLKEGADCDLLS
jgi:hypothetical protein